MDEFVFDRRRCERDLAEFGEFLDAKQALRERDDVQAFFKLRPHLAALIGAFDLDVGPATRLQFEFPIFGEFRADLALGNHNTRKYVLVEFEDATDQSIFRQAKTKHNREWGHRFEHGFSQLVDWFHAIDDLKKTDLFEREFGRGHVQLYGLLLIGRSQYLDEYDRKRLDWRTDKVAVDSRKVLCMTFDDFYQQALFRISHYPIASD